MNGAEVDSSVRDAASCRLDSVVEQSNMEGRLEFPDTEFLEERRRQRTREAMEV